MHRRCNRGPVSCVRILAVVNLRPLRDEHSFFFLFSAAPVVDFVTILIKESNTLVNGKKLIFIRVHQN